MVIHIVYMVERGFHLIFLVMQITSPTFLFHHGVEMVNFVPSVCSSKYSMKIFAMTGETGESIADP